MLRILADGDARYRLEDAAGAHVGWIRGRALGFLGPRSDAEAMAAVAAAWPSFDAALERHFAGWPREAVALDQLRTVHDGAYEWVSDGRRPLARLIRPPADGHGALGIEFVLPSYASEGVVISVAPVVANALRTHGAGSVASRGRARTPAVVAGAQ